MDIPATPPVQRAFRPPNTGGANNQAEVRRAAEQFEAQTLGILLQPMFDTVDTSKGSFGGGAAEAQWRPMLVDAYANAAVRSGKGIGLSDAIIRDMTRIAEGRQATQPSAPTQRPDLQIVRTEAERVRTEAAPAPPVAVSPARTSTTENGSSRR